MENYGNGERFFISSLHVNAFDTTIRFVSPPLKYRKSNINITHITERRGENCWILTIFSSHIFSVGPGQTRRSWSSTFPNMKFPWIVSKWFGKKYYIIEERNVKESRFEQCLGHFEQHHEKNCFKIALYKKPLTS